jgi:hypothetical protein
MKQILFLSCLFLLFSCEHIVENSNSELSGITTTTNSICNKTKVYIYSKKDALEPLDSTIADSSGHFYFRNLPNGVYVISADKDGKEGIIKHDVYFDSSTETHLSLKLLPYQITKIKLREGKPPLQIRSLYGAHRYLCHFQNLLSWKAIPNTNQTFSVEFRDSRYDLNLLLNETGEVDSFVST